MNLRATQLVVLSACETGVGEANPEDSVAGLRRAFQVAGVQTTVMSLWRVPDQETSALMAAFYGNLNAGRGRAQALNDAALQMMRSHREKNGAAHPFFWGGFISVGSPMPIEW